MLSDFWGKIKSFVVSRKITSAIIAIVALIIIVSVFNRGNGQDYELITVSRGDIKEEVSATGKVEAAQNLELAFEKSGKVAAVYKKVGESVVAGQLLVSLNNADLSAQLRQAQASVAQQQAKLDELKLGTRPEEIAIKEAELDKAEQDLLNANSSAISSLKSAYALANEAVRTTIAPMFYTRSYDNFDLAFLCLSFGKSDLAEELRARSESYLVQWQSELSDLTLFAPISDQAKIDQALVNAKNYSDTFLGLIDALSDTLIASSGCSVTGTTLTTYKGYVDTARTSIVSASSSISSAAQSVESNKFIYLRIKNELNLKLAGSTPEQVAAQEAVVASAIANAQSISAQIGKGIIRSPINGLVTRMDAKVGTIVAANSPVTTVISDKKYQIKSNIAEADIVKVNLNDQATVTLDAFGLNEEFVVTVVAIDPAETVIGGVSTYEVTFEFIQEDERIKSGMTANLDILTNEQTDVLILPARAVVSRNGKKFVLIMNSDGTTREVEVRVGLRGSDGNVEILEGLTENEQVAIAKK